LDLRPEGSSVHSVRVLHFAKGNRPSAVEKVHSAAAAEAVALGTLRRYYRSPRSKGRKPVFLSYLVGIQDLSTWAFLVMSQVL